MTTDAQRGPVLTVHPDGERVQLKPGETILEGLSAAGFGYRIGCRRGGCAVCKVDLLAGTVSYNRPVADTVLTEEERASGTCLTCRAVPDGDITIELRGESLKLISSLLRKLRQAPPEPGVDGAPVGSTS